MRTHALALHLLALLALLPTRAPAGDAAPRTDDERAAYVVGRQVAEGLAKLHLSPRELELVQLGMRDQHAGAPSAVDGAVFGAQRMERWASAREKAGVQIEHDRGAAYAAKVAGQRGAVTLPSGVVFRELAPGAGRAPAPEDYLVVHVRGRLTDGQVFDDSRARARPLHVQLHPRFIPCWTEGLRRMRAGGKAEVVCPAAKAFGDTLGRPPLVLPGATVVYELELVEIARDPPR